MSDGKNTADRKGPRAGESRDRELFVSTDIRSIPVMELRPICGSLRAWLTAILAFKVFRTMSPTVFASESRRLVRIDAEQVPKRIMKRFDKLRPQIELLGFQPNYYASLPAIGPIAAAVMTMSHEEGQIHFFATEVVLQADGQIHDDGHFGFSSRISDDTSILTISPAKLPRARKGVDRLIVPSEDPAIVLKKHRERIRGKKIVEVPAGDVFEYSQLQTRLEAEDLLRRRIIRPATQREITRIRSESRV